MDNFKCKSFNQAMVKAIMNGSKTQTRRLLKHQPPSEWDSYRTITNESGVVIGHRFEQSSDPDFGGYLQGQPSHKVGDIIGVKEKLIRWCESMSLDHPYYAVDKTPVVPNRRFIDLHEGLRQPWCWKGNTRQANHMPKWAIRKFLEVTGFRLERIQDTSIEDIRAEGVTFKSMESLLMSSWGKLRIEDCYWFNGDDACGDYCQNCGQKAVEEANKALEPNAEKYILEGYERVTSDSNATCITCGVHLEYWLTEWGIESELDHLEKYLTYPYSQSEKYELYCLFESAIHSHGLNIDDWNTGKPERIELAGRLYKLAMRIVWESIYPGSWDKNEWVEIIDFIITENK